MRDISGYLKGKSINFIKNSTTRPLKDSVKENIFNVLAHSNQIKIKLEGANVLDLYSGIGSFGIECISRGAQKVTFVEKDNNAAKILNKNLLNFSIKKITSVYNGEIDLFLEKKNYEKFNIFFLDPPFKSKEFIENIEVIKKSQFFEDNHIVVIHREIKSNDNLDKYINVLITKYYGRSKIIFGTFNWAIFL